MFDFTTVCLAGFKKMEHLKHFYRKQNFGFFFTPRDYIFDLSLFTALLDIHQKSCEKLQKFLGSNRLFCFIIISKFRSFKNPFGRITNLSECHFRCRRMILLVQTKVISVSYDSSSNS